MAREPRDRRDRRERDERESEFVDKLVHINRVAKVVKGGRRFGFAALVVVGDEKGRGGVGHGKAREGPGAIRKATEAAKRGLLRGPLRGGRDRESTRLKSSHANISYALFFFNDTATTEIYTLSLHDALPIYRVAKVVKGGRRFGFAALVVVGDEKGRVGFGHGKAREVPEAIRKATEAAKRGLIRVPLREGRTLHHDVAGRHGAGRVFLRAAPPRTGIIAGGPMRAGFETPGMQDGVAKSLGSV